MKAIHNRACIIKKRIRVVSYPKDTKKWKQFTTIIQVLISVKPVVSYPKDTKKWKQFTTGYGYCSKKWVLCHIPKILKNESNSQPFHDSDRY